MCLKTPAGRSVKATGKTMTKLKHDIMKKLKQTGREADKTLELMVRYKPFRYQVFKRLGVMK